MTPVNFMKEVKALGGGRWSWMGQPKEIHTDIEFAMNEVRQSSFILAKPCMVAMSEALQLLDKKTHHC